MKSKNPAAKDDAVVKYASKYLTNLPDEETLRREILTTRRAIRASLEAR